jgi:hypothetical protein
MRQILSHRRPRLAMYFATTTGKPTSGRQLPHVINQPNSCSATFGLLDSICYKDLHGVSHDIDYTPPAPMLRETTLALQRDVTAAPEREWSIVQKTLIR